MHSQTVKYALENYKFAQKVGLFEFVIMLNLFLGLLWT